MALPPGDTPSRRSVTAGSARRSSTSSTTSKTSPTTSTRRKSSKGPLDQRIPASFLKRHSKVAITDSLLMNDGFENDNISYVPDHLPHLKALHLNDSTGDTARIRPHTAPSTAPGTPMTPILSLQDTDTEFGITLESPQPTCKIENENEIEVGNTNEIEIENMNTPGPSTLVSFVTSNSSHQRLMSPLAPLNW